MLAERIVTAISSLSECDMLENVRRHNAVGDVHSDAVYHDNLRADMYQTLPAPSNDAVFAFESAMQGMQTGHTVAPVGHVPRTNETHFANALSLVDGASISDMQADILPQYGILPSPETLLADGVRKMQATLVEPSWMEAVSPVEKDAFQRGLECVDALFQTTSPDALSHKELLQLQFAMGEIGVYKDIGLQISKKTASNIEAVLKQQE